MTDLVALELCSGAGGQAIGLERAGFTFGVLLDNEAHCCATLALNRPRWPVICSDIARLPDADRFAGVDLLSGGLPCVPHSRGGRQLGQQDERHIWGAALDLAGSIRPRAVCWETTSDIFRHRFAPERAETIAALNERGFTRVWWRGIRAEEHGVSQRRHRAILVAFRDAEAAERFRFPGVSGQSPPMVGDLLSDLVGARGWPGASPWAVGAADLAPTVTIGSTKHGGPDLGPTQSRRAWSRLGVDGSGVADEAPGPDGKYTRGRGITRDAAEHGLMLTVPMLSRLQAFPASWQFSGGKTAAARQIGNAFPPPVAAVLGAALADALEPSW